MTTLARGIHILRFNTKYMFVAALLFVFPLLFVTLIEATFSTAQNNIVTAQKQQIQTLYASLEAVLRVTAPENIEFETYQAAIPQLEAITVLRESKEGFFVVAATDENLIGSIDGASPFFALSAATTDGAYIYEYEEAGARKWRAYEQIQTVDTPVFAVATLSFETVDAVMAARQQQVYIGLSAIFVFLLAVAYWLVRQQNAAAAYQTLRAKQDEHMLFTNTMAHELRAPLTVIKGYASLLLEAPTLKDDERSHVSKISTASERLILLINDFLEVARLQAGKLTVATTETDIAELVRQAMSTFQSMADKKGIALTYQGPSSVTMSTDSTRLTQVITNLLSNALKYTETGSVTVYLDQTRTTTTIKVKDTGYGISAEDQRRLFTPFTRVGKADASKVTGTGLGMWITKQITELLGGTIALESIEGTGTAVKLTFRS